MKLVVLGMCVSSLLVAKCEVYQHRDRSCLNWPREASAPIQQCPSGGLCVALGWRPAPAQGPRTPTVLSRISLPTSCCAVRLDDVPARLRLVHGSGSGTVDLGDFSPTVSVAESPPRGRCPVLLVNGCHAQPRRAQGRNVRETGHGPVLHGYYQGSGSPSPPQYIPEVTAPPPQRCQAAPSTERRITPLPHGRTPNTRPRTNVDNGHPQLMRTTLAPGSVQTSRWQMVLPLYRGASYAPKKAALPRARAFPNWCLYKKGTVRQWPCQRRIAAENEIRKR